MAVDICRWENTVAVMNNGCARTKPLVSVVVISKDEPQLDETLTLLERECAAVGGECIVVDASDGRLDWVADNHPTVRWVPFAPPIDGASSIPQQRNIGVREATGAVIAFCDSGGEPCEGWLAALVAPILVGAHRYTCGPVRSTRPGVYRVINDLGDGEASESPPTANVAFETSLFEEVGGFDDRYAYGSDVDFAWRCADVGAPPVCVRAAVMGMDWGQWQLQKRRSWRYGRARARLCRIHPRRRVAILRQQPEIIAYPLITGGAVVGIIVALLGWLSIATVVVGTCGSLAAALRWRGRHNEQPKAVMLGHVIYGWAYWFELLFGPRRKPVVVRHTPVDDGPYVRSLVGALNDAGVRCDGGWEATKSATTNILCAPVSLVWWRLRGVRIWHIHWTWTWVPRWIGGRRGRRVARWWFTVQLGLARRLGIKVVWTAHNLYPHDAVFDDDHAARRALIEHCDLVIAHTEEAAARVRDAFDVHPIVIDQGPIEVPLVPRERARLELGVGEQVVVLAFGKVVPYKGFDLLLEAAASGALERWKDSLEIRIVGLADMPYRETLDALTVRLNSDGWAVTTVFEQVSDERLGLELSAADVCVFPFRDHLNSSTLRAAQYAGRYSIVAGVGTYEHVAPCDPTAAGIAGAVDAALHLTRGERDEVGSAGQELARLASWQHCADSTREAYRRVLQGGDEQ